MRGVVQGVGFRPHVFALARKLELAGAVWNNADGVVVEVEGEPADLDAFRQGLRDEAPPLAVVTALEEREVQRLGGTGFEIMASEHAPGRTWVSPDVTICADCLADLRDPSNRRYRHPFVTCTNCGPRYTITTGLPYDRPTTTMAGFPMCEACAEEYADPADRRFHAQTICCPACGPVLSLVEAAQVDHGQPATGEQALARGPLADRAPAEWSRSRASAATTWPATPPTKRRWQTLRKRKQRGDKPFAVMVRLLDRRPAARRCSRPPRPRCSSSRAARSCWPLGNPTLPVWRPGSRPASPIWA